jgi:exosortase A-associated hydrolase 1
VTHHPVRESFVAFDVRGDTCVGVLSRPADAAEVGVVIVVGGPQYRAGSHRQFTQLARDLAAGGVAVLRFDYRGMGDSDGDPRTFESIDDDVAAAIGVLQREAGVSRVALWGLCDAASAALMYAAGDARVAGVIAVNPETQTEATLSATRLRHYYAERVLAPEFWRKVLRGGLDWRASARGISSSLRAAAAPAQRPLPFQERMHRGWRALRAPLLVILSGRDLTARAFESWVQADDERRALLARASVVPIAAADHTFSDSGPREAMTRATLDWAARLCEAS